MKVKTSELSGAALDWAVATAEGLLAPMSAFPYGSVVMVSGRLLKLRYSADDEEFSPSTDWAQGGPIIERECISVDWMARMVWDARIYVPDEEPWQMDGETMLIAAMRCFVASKLGDEVDVPEGLL